MSMMSIETIIQEMIDICQKQGVEHLILFGSFATNTALEKSARPPVLNCKRKMNKK